MYHQLINLDGKKSIKNNYMNAQKVLDVFRLLTRTL